MCRWCCARFFFKLLNIIIAFFSLFSLIWIGCVRMHLIESWANTLTARSAILQHFMVDSCEFTATGITFYGRVRITVSTIQRHLFRQFYVQFFFSSFFSFLFVCSSRWHFHFKLRLIIFNGKIYEQISLFFTFSIVPSLSFARFNPKKRAFQARFLRWNKKKVKRSKTKKVNKTEKNEQIIKQKQHKTWKTQTKFS